MAYSKLTIGARFATFLSSIVIGVVANALGEMAIGLVLLAHQHVHPMLPVVETSLTSE